MRQSDGFASPVVSAISLTPWANRSGTDYKRTELKLDSRLKIISGSKARAFCAPNLAPVLPCPLHEARFHVTFAFSRIVAEGPRHLSEPPVCNVRGRCSDGKQHALIRNKHFIRGASAATSAALGSEDPCGLIRRQVSWRWIITPESVCAIAVPRLGLRSRSTVGRKSFPRFPP